MIDSLVSVIVPVYNAENYLEVCINSILKQTYQNIELILINDGSTDNSDEICKKYSNIDNRVRYIFQENSGPSKARNKGLELARGDYIQFVDSDDFLEKNCIEILVKSMKDSDLVIASYTNVYGNKNKIVVKPPVTGLLTKGEFLDSFGLIMEEQLFHYTWHKLYKRKLLSNIRFKEAMKIGEDLIFNIQYMENVKSVHLISEVVYNHVLDNQTSITKKYHDNLFATRKFMHKELIRFLEKNKKYHGNNRDAVENLYVNRIIGCFYNINNRNSSLSYSDRKKECETIVNDSTVREIIDRFNHKNIVFKIYGKLIKYKKYHLILFFSMLIIYVNRVRIAFSQ